MSISELGRTCPAGGSLVVGVEYAPDAARVTVTAVGEIDIVTADHLRDTLMAALHRSPAALDLDLSGVTFLDSSGIHALMAARASALAGGCRFAVLRPQPFVRRVLAVCGLLDALNLA